MSRSILISAKYNNNKKSIVGGLHNSCGSEYKESLWNEEEYNYLIEDKLNEFVKQNKNKKIKSFEVSINISCCNNNCNEDYLNEYATRINFNNYTTLKNSLQTIFLLHNTILKHKNI